MSGVFRTIDPPPPLHPTSVSSPRTKCGEVHTRQGWGGGGSIFQKTTDIGLASYSMIHLRDLQKRIKQDCVTRRAQIKSVLFVCALMVFYKFWNSLLLWYLIFYFLLAPLYLLVLKRLPVTLFGGSATLTGHACGPNKSCRKLPRTFYADFSCIQWKVHTGNNWPMTEREAGIEIMTRLPDLSLKGQWDFCFWFFSWISLPPAPDRFKFFREFAEIFASQGSPPVSTKPVANWKSRTRFVC